MAWITDKDVEVVLKAYFDGKKYELKEFRYEPFAEVLGFHGSHGLLLAETKEEGETSFFVKSTTKDEEVFKKYYAGIRCFYKEHVMMTKVLRDLQMMVKPKLTSVCYLSKEDEFIVLEDLTKAGYEVMRAKEMDFAHAECALKAFATLHAASIIEEEKQGVYIPDKYKEIAFETFFVKRPQGVDCLMYSLQKGSMDMGDAFFTEVPLDDRRGMLEFAIDSACDFNGVSKEYRNVVCQGDPWGNNVLYRYDEEGRPREACLVDFQASRVAPPGLEVEQFLHLAGKRISGDGSRGRLEKAYHRSLGGALAREGLDVEALLPEEVFLESCRLYRRFGLATRLYYGYLTRIPPAYLLPAASTPESFLALMIRGDPTAAVQAFENDTQYREQFTEAFLDILDYWRKNVK